MRYRLSLLDNTPYQNPDGDCNIQNQEDDSKMIPEKQFLVYTFKLFLEYNQILKKTYLEFCSSGLILGPEDSSSCLVLLHLENIRGIHSVAFTRRIIPK